MKKFSLLLSLGMMLYLVSCAPAKKEEPAADLNLASPYNAIMVRHGVANYDTFKLAFMGHDSMRTAAGMTDISVGRGSDDPNSILVIGKIADVQKAKDFAASQSLKDAMQKAGVTGAPMIDFMKVIRDDTSKISTNNRVMVIHHVKDFDTWLKVYDGEGVATRATYGIVDRGMGRGIDDPNTVYLLFAVTDAAKANARMQSEELKKVMTDAGVDGPPSFYKFAWDDSVK